MTPKLEESILENLEKAKALRQSILKKAFEGKLLTAQELKACKAAADYEPAGVLLERIERSRNGRFEREKKGVGKNEGKKVEKKKTVNKPKIVAKTKMSTTDLHAAIITKTIQLHEKNPTHLSKLNHIKCEKIAHLVESHLGINLGRNPVKDAAGPDDYPHLKLVESRSQKAGFFKIVKQSVGYTYSSGNQSFKILDRLENVLSPSTLIEINTLLQKLLKFDLQQAEILATTFAGWNNLLLDGKTPTKEEIVTESRENWSKRKMSIPRDKFFKAIEWMIANNIVPTGTGKRVNAKQTKI